MFFEYDGKDPNPLWKVKHILAKKRNGDLVVINGFRPSQGFNWSQKGEHNFVAWRPFLVQDALRMFPIPWKVQNVDVSDVKTVSFIVDSNGKRLTEEEISTCVNTLGGVDYSFLLSYDRDYIIKAFKAYEQDQELEYGNTPTEIALKLKCLNTKK